VDLVMILLNSNCKIHFHMNFDTSLSGAKLNPL